MEFLDVGGESWENLALRPDVIHPAADLDPYRVVFTPYLAMLDESGLRERLPAWIKAGGTWIAQGASRPMPAAASEPITSARPVTIPWRDG